MHKNNGDDVFTTHREVISLIFKKDEVLHVYDQYKDKSLSTWALAVDKGYATKDVAYDPKGIFVCTLIVRAINKAQRIIANRESKEVTKLDNGSVRDIIYDQYDIVLQNEARAFASINRNK